MGGWSDGAPDRRLPCGWPSSAAATWAAPWPSCSSPRPPAIAERSGIRFELAGVAVLDLDRPRPAPVPAGLLTDDAKELVERPGVDVVVELIGGLDPARTLVEAALRAGRPVVTANKALLAEAGAELAGLAAAHGVDLLYEASVAGAIPVIRPLRESLAGERVVRVMGIVNGTTNFILTRMSRRRHGLRRRAWPRPSGWAAPSATRRADVEGHDAAAKAAILAGLAFGSDLRRRRTSTARASPGVRAVDVAFADRLGYVVKLLAVAELVDGGPDVSVRVHPAMVPRSHPLASVRGAFNAVFVEGEGAGELMLYGRGAGGPPTASAVLGDLIDAARNLRSGRARAGAPAGGRRGPPAGRAPVGLLPQPRRGRPPGRAGRGGRPSSATTASPSGPWSRWAWATRRGSSS